MRLTRARAAFAAGLLVALVLSSTTFIAVAQQPTTDAKDRPFTAESEQLRAAIEQSLSPEPVRNRARFPSVRIDKTGDATVVFAMRDAGTIEELRGNAIEDAIAILEATYNPPVTDKISTITVVGTYLVAGGRGEREWPVLRVTLDADHAASTDWDQLTTDNVDSEVDEFWIYPPLLEAEDAATQDDIISSPIDIGDRNLFLRCIGSGSPTIILEAGYGDDGTMWAPVQLRASTFTRVCSYDRANLARSGDAPVPRTAQQIVDDLHALLTAADVQPPYVMVGHSYGALYSRLFASEYPDDVAGLVLIDGWHEDYDAQLKQLVDPSLWTQWERLLAEDPDYEVVDLDQSYEEMRDAAPLPNVPLLVISHGLKPDESCCPTGWPIDQMDALWQDFQDQLATLEPNSRHIVARSSGHAIHQADPDFVVAGIKEVVDAVRDPSTWEDDPG
jgi:pimeloyl-ACP methyl ester carboxylesterase